MYGRRRDRLFSGLPREARRPSPIFVFIVALFALTGVLLWFGVRGLRWWALLFVLSGWVVSLCLHEFAHALMAYRSGDTTVAARGYLTLDPFKYAHPVLSIVLPLLFVLLGGIGLPGGAVWIDHGMIRNRTRETLISLAGPGTNFVFALITIAPFWFGVVDVTHAAFWGALAFLAFLQLTAAILNLLPVPGLDGGNAVRPWLNYEWRKAFNTIAPWGMIVVFALLMNARLGGAFFSAIFWVGGALGLDPLYVDIGRSVFPSLGTLFQ